MNIGIRSKGDCPILELDGSLVLGPATQKLREAVDEAAGNMPRKIVLDLEKVTYIDSCGVGQLIGSLVHVQALGGDLVLLKPTDRVMQPILRVKLETVFKIFQDEQAAIADSGERHLLFQANA
jgi:anti-sigma B factor antagonist